MGPLAADKTWWAQQVAEALGVDCEFVALPSVPAALVISRTGTLARRVLLHGIDVRVPNRSERAALIASIWRHYRTLRSDLRLPTALGTEVIDVFAKQFQDARQMLRLFDDGFGRAARRRGPLRLLAADVGGAPVRPCPAPGPLPG